MPSDSPTGDDGTTPDWRAAVRRDLPASLGPVSGAAVDEESGFLVEWQQPAAGDVGDR